VSDDDINDNIHHEMNEFEETKKHFTEMKILPKEDRNINFKSTAKS
jgi:hypothetical protein